MEYYFTIGDEPVSIEVEKIESSRYQLTVDGETFDIEALPLSSNCIFLSLGKSSCTAYVAENHRGSHIFIKGEQFLVEETSRSRCVTRADPAREKAQIQDLKTELCAPMPGKIVKILISPGDRISAGQPLFIVESMKMENEVRAPAPGKVKEVLRKKDDLVFAKDPVLKLVFD